MNEDIPENMNRALDVIDEAICYGFDTLDLSNLQLTTNQLNSLLIIIEERLPNLKKLFLDNNKIKVLPKEIANLLKLEDLELDNNEISELPVEIGKLVELKSLFLGANNLLELPVEIGDLCSLEYLSLPANLLIEVPDTLNKLGELEELNLDGNPLSQETLNFLSATFDEEVFSLEIFSINLGVNYKEVLLKIYGGKSDELVSKIEALDSSWCFLDGSDDVAEAQKKIRDIESGDIEDESGIIKQVEERKIKNHTFIASDVVKLFLKEIPLEGNPDSNPVYYEGAQHLIDLVLDNNTLDEEKQSTLYKIAETLVNCSTPVKDILVHAYIDKCRNRNPKPTKYHALIARQAIESEIISKLRNKKNANGKLILKSDEEIEQVHGLLNAIFMEGALNNPKNKCKIRFLPGEQPDTLPSIIFFTDNAFDKVSDELAKEFAKLCCITDEKGECIFSLTKYVCILEKYYSEALGEISLREAAIANYIKKISEIISEKNLTLHYDMPEVKQFLEFDAQEQELREKLLKVSDSEVETYVTEYLKSQNEKIEKIHQVIENQNSSDDFSNKKGLGELENPINSTRRNRKRKKVTCQEAHESIEDKSKKAKLKK